MPLSKQQRQALRHWLKETIRHLEAAERASRMMTESPLFGQLLEHEQLVSQDGLPYTKEEFEQQQCNIDESAVSHQLLLASLPEE